MKKEKEYIDAEIVDDNSFTEKAKKFAGDQMKDEMEKQFQDVKRALLLKGGFYLAFWLLIFLLILGLIIRIIFWLLPVAIAFVLSVLILGIILNLSYKIYSFFKK